MSARVLLLSINRCADPEPVFPLALSHLSAALTQAGHATEWLDLQAETRPWPTIVEAYKPDFVGVSVRNLDDILIGRQQTFYDELGSICGQIRLVTPAPLILGGSGFSIFPLELLERAGADFGIIGEGEASLVHLIRALQEGTDYRSIDGLVYRTGGQIAANPPRSCRLGALPSACDPPPGLVAHYVHSTGTLNVQTQRGCGHHCCYCTYPVIEGRQHRHRDGDDVAAELERLTRLGARYIFIVDSVFNSFPGHVVDICEAILRRGLQLRWSCFLRPVGLTSDLMALMAKAGLAHIEFGSDSFCDQVLDAYQKDLTFDDILAASEHASRAGLPYCHFLVCGGPGETPETVRQSFANFSRLPNPIALAVAGMRIYPGTSLARRARKDGVIQADTDLLRPAYYLAPGLTVAGIRKQLQDFAGENPNWVTGESVPTLTSLSARLRQRKVTGPLWQFYPTLQRLWPGSSDVSFVQHR